MSDTRLRELIDTTASRYIKLSTAWLEERGENFAYTPGDDATYDTPKWVRFLRWEFQLILAAEDGSEDEFERLCALMTRLALISSAMVGIETAEFAAFRVQGKGAAAKWARDPRQKEKAAIREKWSVWPARLSGKRYKAAFAREMLDQCEHLSDEKTITEWCRQWEREQ